MANFMNSALVRRMEVPKRQPPIAKVLEPHAARVLEPTIEKISHGTKSRTDIPVKVVGIYDGEAAAVATKVGPDFKGSPGQQKEVYNNGVYTIYIGLGKRDKFDDEAAKKFGALAVRTAEKLRSDKVEITVPRVDNLLPTRRNEVTYRYFRIEAITTGAVLAAYRFDMRIGTPKAEKPVSIREIHLVSDDKGTAKAIESGLIKAGGQNIARYISDLPAGEIDAVRYAQLIRLLAWKHDLHFGLLTAKELVRMGREGIATVSAGSPVPGAMVLLGSFNDLKGPLDVFVGKGIDFDSGGLSLKTPNEHMLGMHMDKEGSGETVGAMTNQARLGNANNVLGALCLARNVIGPNGAMPTQVIRIGDRKVRIVNTDAEGRLVMADGVSVASELGPRSITTTSTLTGACVLACGEGMYIGLMTADDGLRDMYSRRGAQIGEKVIYFPIDHPYLRESLIEDGPADINNLGPRPGGHLTAQVFLREFAHFRGRDGNGRRYFKNGRCPGRRGHVYKGPE